MFNQEAHQDPPPKKSPLIEDTLDEFKKFIQRNLEVIKVIFSKIDYEPIHQDDSKQLRSNEHKH